MPEFTLALETRRVLYHAGFGGVDVSLRAAAVELEFFFVLDSFHWMRQSDGGFRHYTNFLAWADTTAVGINEGIQSTDDQGLKARWDALGDEPFRQWIRELRHQALKHRRDIAPVSSIDMGDGIWSSRTFGEYGPHDVLGQFTDFLWWLKDKALPLLIEAIELGAEGDDPLLADVPLDEQMAFPHSDPWTTKLDPEFAMLMTGDIDVPY